MWQRLAHFIARVAASHPKRELALSHYAAKPQILYIGNEPDLSKATCAVLKRGGYRVRTTNPRHICTVLSDCKFGAIILCATLSSEETEMIVDHVQTQQQDVAIVSLHLGSLGDEPNARSTAIIDVLEGPDVLLHSIESLSADQRRPSKQP